jgi:hypothetical protein
MMNQQIKSPFFRGMTISKKIASSSLLSTAVELVAQAHPMAPTRLSRRGARRMAWCWLLGVSLAHARIAYG